MFEEQEHPDSGAFPLAKLIYSLVSIFAVVDYAGPFAKQLLLSRHTAAAVSYAYLAQILLPIVISVVLIFFYRPSSRIFGPVESRTERGIGLFRLVLYGGTGGLVAFAFSIPFLLLGDTDGEFVAGAVSTITSAKGLPLILLLIIALPVAMEAIFRGITFRTLAICANVPSAVIASSLLFAHVWPAFGWPIGVILGVVSALLYRRTNSLVPSVLANAVLTLSGGAFLLYRALARQ